MAKTSKLQDSGVPDERGYVRDKALAQHFSVSRTTVWRWSKIGRLPRPHKLSPGVTAWRKSELKEMGLM